MPRPDGIVPALGFHRLTKLYDPVVLLTTRERRFKQLLLDQAAVQPGQRVLDLGCGTGTLAIAAKQLVPRAEVRGFDGDPAVVEQARAKSRAQGVEVSFDEGRAEHLPYDDGSFDLVLSTLFFHHLTTSAKEQTAREVARVLTPGGQLHVADWGPPSDMFMRVAFTTVRLLDGLENTRANVNGVLPKIFRSAGMESDGERGRLRTPLGSIVFYAAQLRTHP